MDCVPRSYIANTNCAYSRLLCIGSDALVALNRTMRVQLDCEGEGGIVDVLVRDLDSPTTGVTERRLLS